MDYAQGHPHGHTCGCHCSSCGAATNTASWVLSLVVTWGGGFGNEIICTKRIFKVIFSGKIWYHLRPEETNNYTLKYYGSTDHSSWEALGRVTTELTTPIHLCEYHLTQTTRSLNPRAIFIHHQGALATTKFSNKRRNISRLSIVNYPPTAGSASVLKTSKIFLLFPCVAYKGSAERSTFRCNRNRGSYHHLSCISLSKLQQDKRKDESKIQHWRIRCKGCLLREREYLNLCLKLKKKKAVTIIK